MKKTITALVIFILTVSASITGSAETVLFKKFQLLPKDDSSGDKEFSLFIAAFRKAVKDKNINLLRNSIAADLVWSFGDEAGIKGFMKNWKLDKNPGISGFWDEMDKVISLEPALYNEENGENEKKISYAFPYLFVTFPAEYDSYEYSAVTGKNVNVRKSPASKSPVIEVLNYEIVKNAGVDEKLKKEKIEGINGTWIKVITSTGKTGYIFSRHMHSPIGYRAIFEKREKKWMLTAFISGD